jgi:predicted XRE-type DNA-binding protein
MKALYKNMQEGGKMKKKRLTQAKDAKIFKVTQPKVSLPYIVRNCYFLP